MSLGGTFHDWLAVSTIKLDGLPNPTIASAASCLEGEVTPYVNTAPRPRLEVIVIGLIP